MELVILIVIVGAIALGVFLLRKPYGIAPGQAAGLWEQRARPVPRPHRPPLLPEADTEPPPAGHGAGGSVQVFIHYEDAQGNESKRRITLRQVERREYGAYITAYCHERKEPRCFRSDRILELVDTETGEIFDDPLDFLAPFYLAAESLMEAAGKCAAAVTLLVALGRSDGRFIKKEQQIIKDYVQAEIGGGKINTGIFYKFLSKQRPTGPDIADALADTRNWSAARARLFMVAAKNLVEVDGSIHENEKKILESLYDLFKMNRKN